MTDETDRPHPVVLRFEGMTPKDLAGYEAHRKRRGGDLGHVDRARSPLNRPLIGGEDWAQQALAEIAGIKAENFADELEALERRKRRKDLRRRLAEGPKDPWRASRHGPLREVILTANRAWFEEGDLEAWMEDSTVNARERAFEERAVAWLNKQFGEDVIHARADLDESAYHIHAVILPRTTVEIKGATRRMLQPSKHEMIRDYEAAQDSVGTWFAGIGLCRGERRKQAIREALNSGKAPPASPRHVRPAEWRRQEEKRLAEKAAAVETRERAVSAREEEARDVLDYAEAVARGALDEDGRDTAPAEGGSVLVAARRRSSGGFQRARRAFRAGMKRLAQRAEMAARQTAQAEVAEAFAEIRAADDIIVEIARQLSDDLRARIVRARRALAPRLVRLGRLSVAPGRNRGGPPDHIP